MNITHSQIRELLIVSVTPENLERGVLWFSENRDALRRAAKTHPWWSRNAFFIESDSALKPGELARRLADLGYERTQSVRGPGLFAARGGVIEAWPVNADAPFLVEFRGNIVAEILERPKPETETVPPRPARDLERLQPGGFVVHADHGVGFFRGLAAKEQIQNSNIEIRNKSKIQNSNDQNNFGFRASDFEFSTTKNSEEFFVVEYAPPAPGRQPDRLFVPTEQKDRLTPYVGFDTPRVHRLGGNVWEKTKKRAREDATKLAKELLELYAGRRHAVRPPYAGDQTLEQDLRSSFAFQETDDQLRAEKEIMNDFETETPMDRVLCGDVGFGKTEIAIRSALRVIASGKQVALLSPTTVLASQHERTFAERLEPLGAHARLLSRIVPPREQKKILAEIRAGAIDCIIGTHRLLSSDVEFKNLGLIIIDEEQRFGVKHKEHFKSLRSGVDVLSLSATPIPRTLQFTLSGLRDISRIETPPAERLAIRTFVLPYSLRIIREAIRREVGRGGQVYFLHNRIETIGAAAEKLKKLFGRRPVRIGTVHGRMRDQEMVKTMAAFREGKLDVLLATTIIENGLDISSANTLIVDEATRLGLSQAHQLRGRIGRSSEQAYAYFLYRPRHLTDKAAERLEALASYADLGAGYEIALRDLEIRGAGNVLGREQSGAINRVGLNLYYQMLAEAIEDAQTRER